MTFVITQPLIKQFGMNAWQELVRQALIGNISNKKIAPLLMEQLQGYGLSFSSDEVSERLLLKVAAMQHKLYTTAQIPNTTVLEEECIAPEEKLPYCHPQRRYQLQYILKYKYDDILLELLQLVAQKEQILLPDILPELLSYGSSKAYLHQAICACIGARGAWLAQFSEEWKYAQQQTIEDENIFFYGKLDERCQYLRWVHQQAPLKAIDLLNQVWDSEGFMTKASFIRILGENLVDSDEPFLEAALTDKRQEVRLPAANLLAQLPHSRLVQRMQALAEQFISYNPKKDFLNIELPPACTNLMKKDGIAPRQIFIKDHGPKANQLAQIIGKIPPTWWEKKYYKTPQQLLHLAAKTEWKNVLVWGWAMAAKNFQATEWILACHRFYLDTFFKHNWSNFSIDFLYQDLDNDLFNHLAEEYLKVDKDSALSDDHPIVTFLLAEGQQWNVSISKKVIQRIKKTIQQESYVFHWSVKAVLKRAAFSIPASLYKDIKGGWPTQSYAWHSWQKEIENMLSILQLRYEINTLEEA